MLSVVCFHALYVVFWAHRSRHLETVFSLSWSRPGLGIQCLGLCLEMWCLDLEGYCLGLALTALVPSLSLPHNIFAVRKYLHWGHTYTGRIAWCLFVNGLTKSRPHDHTWPHGLVNDCTRWCTHLDCCVYNTFSVTSFLLYLIDFTRYNFTSAHFLSLHFLNFIKFWSLCGDAFRTYRQLTAYSMIAPSVRSFGGNYHGP